MAYYLEILKHREISTAILLTLAGILYFVIAYYKERIFRGWASMIGKLFSLKMLPLIIILIIILWTKLDYRTIKEDAYYASIDPALRAYFEELMESNAQPQKVNMQPLRSEFKAIAITSDTINKTILLEKRLNDEFKKHGQYTIDPDSLDYIICFFQQWKKDDYIGSEGIGMATCETENAFIRIVDQKRHEVVDTIIIDINRNPEHLTVETNQFGFGSKTITLSPEELYNYCIGNRK